MEEFWVELENFLVPLGSLGIIVSSLLIVIEALIPMLPLWLFCEVILIITGKPIIAYLLTTTCTVIGGTCMFWICRKWIKKLIDNRFKGKKSFAKAKKLSKKINNMSIPLLSVLIVCPFTPSFAINMGSGLSDMKFRKYLTSMIIGKSCMIFFVVYVGNNVSEALENPIMFLWMVVLLLLAYVVSMLVNNYAEKKMNDSKTIKRKTIRKTNKKATKKRR